MKEKEPEIPRERARASQREPERARESQREPERGPDKATNSHKEFLCLFFEGGIFVAIT